MKVALNQMTRSQFLSIPKYAPVYHTSRKLVGYVVRVEDDKRTPKLHIVWANGGVGRGSWENTRYCQTNGDVVMLASAGLAIDISNAIYHANVRWLLSILDLKQNGAGFRAINLYEFYLSNWSASSVIQQFESLVQHAGQIKTGCLYAEKNRAGREFEPSYNDTRLNCLYASLHEIKRPPAPTIDSPPQRVSTDYVNQLTGKKLSEWEVMGCPHADFFTRATGETTGIAFGVLHAAMAQPYHWINMKGIDPCHGLHVGTNRTVHVAKHLRGVVQDLLHKLGHESAFEINGKDELIRFVPIMKEEVTYETKTVLTPYR